jgi:hypothetical protein
MPLRPLEPPEAVRTAAAAQVHQLATPRGIFPALRDVVRENLALVAPHRMYTLGADAIVSDGLSAAVPAGWRFLVADGDRVVASAELAGDAGEAPSLNGGPYVASTATAIDELERLPLLVQGDYEFRMLKVPALYVVAAWLVGDNDALVPLAPAPSFLAAGRPYSEAEFIGALQGPAQEVVSRTDEKLGA